MGEFSRCPIECRFVAIGHGNKGAGIVRNDQGRHTTDERQGASHTGEPVVLRLSAGGAGEGVARGAQNGHEDTGRSDLAGARIDDRYRRAGIVGEQLLTGTVNLAHGMLQLAGPVFVTGAEGGVLVAAFADRLPVLFPEKRQGDAFLLQFLVNQGVVGFSEGRLAGGYLPVEPFLQFAIVECVGQGPGQAAGTGQSKLFGNNAFGEVERTSNRVDLAKVRCGLPILLCPPHSSSRRSVPGVLPSRG